MKPYARMIAVMGFSACLVGCTGSDGDTASAEGAPAVNPDANEAPVPDNTASVTAEPIAADAPAFARLYPGSTLLQAPVLADGADGPGGMAEFTTDASPQQVIDYYRGLAGNNGLKPVMSMNQGNARAFAALNDRGAEIQVVASNEDDAPTSVQLTWKTGH